MKLIFLLLITITLQAKLINGIAIIVKDEPITLYDIEQEQLKSGKPLKEVTDFMIRKKLEEIERRDRGINVSSSEVYAELDKLASQNKMSLSDFLATVQEQQNITSSEIKEKMREQLLSQKLYSSIAFSKIQPPSEQEKLDYYKRHMDEFAHANSYDVIIYHSKSKQKLQEKINNPMFYSPEVSHQEKTFEYTTLNKQLLAILNSTKENSFSQILPSQQGGFMSFFLKKREGVEVAPFDKVSNLIENTILSEQRKQVLNDYFARLQLNADITTIRLPE